MLHTKNTQISTVDINESSDIQIGNKTVYHGPVTITHFVVDNHHKLTSLVKNCGEMNIGISSDESKSGKTNYFRLLIFFLIFFTSLCAIVAVVILMIYFINDSKTNEEGEKL